MAPKRPAVDWLRYEGRGVFRCLRCSEVLRLPDWWGLDEMARYVAWWADHSACEEWPESESAMEREQ